MSTRPNKFKFNLQANNQENIDYLDVRKVKNNMDIIQDFCFTPKDYC